MLFVYLSYTTFLRGIGDSRSPLIVLVASTLIGVVLAPFLIRGAFGWPGLGIIGAPISNIISTGAGLAGLLVFLEVHDNPLAFSKLRRYLRIEVPLLLTLVRIGIPTGLQFVMISLSEIAVLSFVNRFGSSATAAYGAVNQIVSYVQFPAISIGITSSIFGAQSIGAGRQDRLRKIVRAGVTLNYVDRRNLDHDRVPARARDPLAVSHRPIDARHGARPALDHALELRHLRQHERALGNDAVERQRAVADDDFDLHHLGRRSADRLDTLARPARITRRVVSRTRSRFSSR